MVEIRSDVFPTATHTDEPNGTTPVTTDARWRSLTGLSVALQALFGLAMVAVLGLAVATMALGAALDDADGATGFGPFADAVDALDIYTGALTLLQLVTLGAGVVFIVWMFRLARNNDLLGRPGTTHRPGWAIGGWFVPFANLVIPYRMMRELWQGADPSIRRGDGLWRFTDRSRLVMTWWGLYLIGWGLFGAADFALAPGRYVFGFTVGSTSGASAAETVARLIEEPDDPFAAPLKLVALAVLGSSALAALLLVRRLSLRQLAAAEALGVVVTSRTGEVGTATGATSRRWPWVAVPVAVAVALAGLLVLVPSGRRGDGGDGDGGDGDEVSVGGERFLDPEGYYEIELHPDWEPLQGTATGTEAFAVGSPRAGFQPNVVLVTSEDAQELDEAAYLERVMDQITSTPGFDVLDSGMVSAPSGNDLAYLEWTIDATGAETIHGYTVIDVSHGYSATADMAGPSSTFDELFAEAEPFLLTLRLAA